MNYCIEDWVWSPVRRAKIEFHLMLAKNQIDLLQKLHKLASDYPFIYPYLKFEYMEKTLNENENAQKHLERALELEKENE